MKNKYLIFFVIGFYYFFSYKKNEIDSSTDQIIAPPIPLPDKVMLVKPPNNTICQGIQNKYNTFNVHFEWEASKNTTDYVISILDKNGTEIFHQQLKGTSKSVVMQRNFEFSWTVTAENKAGTNTSISFSSKTPGSLKNTLPSINKIDLNKEKNTIQLTFQDLDGDALFFDAITANNPNFNDTTEYAKNREVQDAKGKFTEHQVSLKKIVWSSPFWLRIRSRDQMGNQVAKTVSYPL